MNRRSRLCCYALLGFLWINATLAQDAAEQKADLTRWAELRVVLEDQRGKPVTGAEVKPYAMSFVEGNAGHRAWDYEKLGSPKRGLSDQDGVALVQYPSRVQIGNTLMTTRLVSLSIGHCDFVSKYVDFNLAMDAAQPIEQIEVELKTGCELQLSAMDEKSTPISHFGVLMPSPCATEYWRDDDNGGRRTNAITDGTWQTMLVKPQENGPTLFSDIVTLTVHPSKAVRIRNVKLRPGTRIVGSLSDKVPRPITGGYVITHSVPKLAPNGFNNDVPSLCWYDSVPIAGDGTFELPSVPRSGVIQVIAICDGFASVSIPNDQRFVSGQLFGVEAALLKPTIEMERTGTLELTLLKPDGTPLESGDVSALPSQTFHRGGTTDLGQRAHSMSFIQYQLLPTDQRLVSQAEADVRPFYRQPIKQGLVVLRGLPIGKEDVCTLNHPQFGFPLNAADQEPWLRFTLESAEPKRITVMVISRP